MPAIGHSGSVPGLTFGGQQQRERSPFLARRLPRGLTGWQITAKNAYGSDTQAFTLTVS